LLLAANESFQDAENGLKVLTGVEVGHSTHHRQAQKVELSPPNIKQKLTEVCLDGGKVRLRSEEKGKPAYWKEYKTGRLQGIYYGAFFQDNFSLINWVNSQNLARTVYCLGDGHDGVWNLFAQIADNQRQILKQGELAPPGAWVARYQVRQNNKKYWYYKLQVPTPYFPCATSSELSKYKHLGKLVLKTI
jgi:hypothetical protein